MDSVRVNVLEAIDVMHEHLTEGLCEAVFDERRVSERRRVWTLTKMVEAWTAIVLRAPKSLTAALEEAAQGGGGFPQVAASPQAFFERSKELRPEFFRDVLQAFTARVLEGEQPCFEADLRKKLGAFTGVFVADGSGLDRIRHRLKMLWNERSVVLPGSLFVLYDLFHGVPHRLEVYADAGGGEVPRLKAQIASLPAGSLIVGDRLFCALTLFEALEARGQFGVVRRKKSHPIKHLKFLGKTKVDGRRVEDVLVEVGTGQTTPKRILRLIRLYKGKRPLEIFTNVLDPERLPAATVLALYRSRWKIERMFYDLKVVLNLRHFYAANANAVAMQVYAATIVYVAMRVVQGRIAQRIKEPPEVLSTSRLFPRIAAASYMLLLFQLSSRAMRAANPGVSLVEPDWSAMRFASIDLDEIRVRPRTGKRRKRRVCPARGKSVSLHRFKPPKPRPKRGR